MKRLRHPIRAITEPFGKAGLIVAVLALILAVTGAAFAAVGLNSKQKKEVKAIAKSFAGKPGAPGPQGPAGTNGTNGTAGKDGAPGAPGAAGKSVVTGNATVAECESGGVTVEVEGAGTHKKVCNGETGFTETLPEGATETGAWALWDVQPASFHLAAALSFAIPLAEPLAGPGCVVAHIGDAYTQPCQVHYINVGEEEVVLSLEGKFVQPSPFCSGTADAPAANSGHLCVYAGHETGQQELAGIEPLTGENVPGASTGGAMLHFLANPGQFLKGSFAVTG